MGVPDQQNMVDMAVEAEHRTVVAVGNEIAAIGRGVVVVGGAVVVADEALRTEVGFVAPKQGHDTVEEVSEEGRDRC